jgi:RHS repeat-associated protein
LTDGSGTIASGGRYNYDAYGVSLGSQPSTLNPSLTSLLYTGEQFDAGLQQYYLRGRYYNQSTGRFHRIDPFAGSKSDPQLLHKYEYAHNDPVNHIDPTGALSLLEITIVTVITFIVSFVYLTVVKKQDPISALFLSGLTAAVTFFLLVEAPLILAAMTAALASGLTLQGLVAVTILSFAETVLIQELWFMMGVLTSSKSTRQEKLATAAALLNTMLLMSVLGRAAAEPIPPPSSPPSPTVTLYRAVSHAEAEQAINTQQFQVGPQGIPGKYFATTYDDAVTWGNSMYKGEPFTVLEVQVPANSMSQWHSWTKLDGIGPAYYAEVRQIVNAIIRKATPPFPSE